MNKPDVIIIGAGLFGSMTAKYLKKKGMSVSIIDDVHPMAASKCSMGVWKSGWINKVIQEEAEQGMPLLDEVCGGIQELEFMNMDKWEVETFEHVDCSLIINEKFIKGKVFGITDNGVNFTDLYGEKRTMWANKAVVVCAGSWTGHILKESGYKDNLPAVDRYWGANFVVDMSVDVSRVQTWAPYKQNVLLKLSDSQFIFGDGATVKNPKDDDDRVDKVSRRLEQHLNEIAGITVPKQKIVEIRQGYRPYLNKNGSGRFVNRHDDRLLSATGGAKNSTILCGHIALELYKSIKKL